MAKFPTDVEGSITVRVPLTRVYTYLSDISASAACIPGLERCEKVGDDTYRFVYARRQYGPVSMVPRYTSRFEGNGRDRIRAAATCAEGDNTEGSGSLRLQARGEAVTRIVMRQKIIPETPLPRLAQGLVRSFVENEARQAVQQYLSRVKEVLERN